ncbi:MAG: flagellar basal body rod protein FlgC [Candidatus Xenobia bacterium]
MPGTNFFSAMDAAASAMTAERFKMDVISENISNANTQNTVTGEPYRRHVAVITPADAPQFALPCALDDDDDDDPKGNDLKGVQVKGVAIDNTPLKYVYDPTNPNAIKQGKMKGYVAMSNVNVITEMTSLIATSRSYDANASVVEAVKSMAMKGMEIGKGG